jgi:3-deoxy-D-manno-octulosonate 8-phosphate phosphatase (KDO 8-P phosphatase)
MPAAKAALLNRARNIKLIAMDVDGVLTAGDVIVLESGEEVKLWNAKDRLGLSLVRAYKLPYLLAWITGRQSKTVQVNADDLGVHFVVQKCIDKKAALKKILDENKLTFDQAAFVGDDLIDISTMRHVGLSACPQDAVSDVKKVAHYISPFNGGRGVVRDVFEFILRAQNQWDPLIERFLD